MSRQYYGIKTGNGTPNRADICHEAAQEWNKIKKKSMVEIDEIIRQYLATQFSLYDIQTMRFRHPVPRKDIDDTTPSLPTIRLTEPTPEIPVNASAQKKTSNEIAIGEKKLTEFEQIYNLTTDSQLHRDVYKKIVDLRDNLQSNEDKIVKLKRNAKYTQRCKEKKQKMLHKNQKVTIYDKPDRPPLLFKYPDLHDHVHDSVEFESADEKRRKEVVKVRIIENLRKNLEEKYNVYMARTTLNNYLLPRQSNSIAARAHHHPAWVAVAGVSRTETRDHPDGHYCLASVKSAKQFAGVFADMSIIISQDDKAKIGLGIPAVGRTFHTLQSIQEPVYVADHDFPAGNYLTVRTHAPGQSKYNPVERSMATLSGKLAGITLPIDHFRTHLNSQGKVINPELALQNFQYAGEALCDIWRCDLIFGRSVDTQYVEELVNPFENLHFDCTEKEKAEQQKQQKKK
ncbi:unnamed protein product [Rhizophagus irregularis]|nr:unnamed protein product [Rhizophagus irregularis]